MYFSWVFNWKTSHVSKMYTFVWIEGEEMNLQSFQEEVQHEEGLFSELLSRDLECRGTDSQMSSRLFSERIPCLLIVQQQIRGHLSPYFAKSNSVPAFVLWTGRGGVWYRQQETLCSCLFKKKKIYFYDSQARLLSVRSCSHMAPMSQFECWHQRLFVENVAADSV